MKRSIQTLISAGFAGLILAVAPQSGAAQQRSGVDIWSQSCNRCHRPQPPNRYTADQWETIMEHMRHQARLTSNEADAVLAFLKSGARQLAQTPSEAAQVAVADSVRVPGNELTPAQRARAARYLAQLRAQERPKNR